MELADVLGALRARWYYAVLVVLVAAAAAFGVIKQVRTVSTGTASVQLLVDSPQSALTNLQQDPQPLVTRASEFAQVMTSNAILASIAAKAGVPAGELTAEGPYSGSNLGLNVETPSAARGVQIVADNTQYHLDFVAEPDIPIVTATIQGPTPAAAGRVANSIVPGVQSWLATLQPGSVGRDARVTIRQIGNVQAGVVNSSSSKILAGVAGAGVLIFGLLIVAGLGGRARRRAAPREEAGPAPIRGPGHPNGSAAAVPSAYPVGASVGGGGPGAASRATVWVPAPRPRRQAQSVLEEFVAGGTPNGLNSTNGATPSPPAPTDAEVPRAKRLRIRRGRQS